MSVTTEPPADRNAGIDLRINLVENKRLPPMTQPLAPEEQAFLTLRKRILASRELGEDMVITWSSPDAPIINNRLFRIILSNDGLLATLLPAPSASMDPMKMIMLGCKETSAYLSPFQASKLQIRGHAFTTMINVTVAASAKGNNLMLGGGIQSSKDAADPPIKYNLSLTPAAFINAGNPEKTQTSIENGRLISKSDNATLSFNADTGDDIKAHAANGKFTMDFNCTFKKGAFKKAYPGIKSILDGQKNAYQPEQPFSSVVAYLLKGLQFISFFVPADLSMDKKKRTLQLLGMLSQGMDAGLLKPLDQAIVRHSKKTQENARSFSIPASMASADQFAAMVSAWVFSACNDLFPEGSWPWTVSRETVFVLGGQSRYTGRILNQLATGKSMGPIGFLTVSRLLALINPHFSRLLASQGLFHLSREAFRKDYGLLFQKETFLTELLHDWLGHLKKVDPDHLDSLTAGLPEAYRQAVLDIRRKLEKSEAVRLGELLPSMLDRLWEQTLRDTVKDALTHLKSPTY